MIAFAYCDQLEELKPIYRGLAEGLIENIRNIMPKQQILMVTDDDTEGFKYCSTLRVHRKGLLMSWRLAAQYCANCLHDEILFTEPDVRFQEDVMSEFNDPDFDVTVCDREFETTMKGEKMSVNCPYTLGSNFSRCPDFWKDAAKICLTYDRKEQLWGGDMRAIAEVAKSGKYRVKVLPASVYCHIPNSHPDTFNGVKILHYKGNRKTWLFKSVKEAA